MLPEPKTTSRITKLMAVLVLALVPALGWLDVAHAQSFRTGDNVNVPSGETVNSTVFASGRSIDIAGTVDGDVFCAGQSVSVTGTVTGDVICAGQTVRISGTVEGDVRVAGQSVTIGGSIGHNLTAVGQSVATDGNTDVKGDASLAGQDLVMNGTVGRDAALAGSNVTINGQVGRNVNANVENLKLGGKAVIGGGVYYTSKNSLARASGAQVGGQVVRSEPKQGAHQGQNKGNGGFGWFVLWFIVSLLLLALVLVLLMPHVFQSATTDAMRRLGMVFLTGFTASILVPIIIFVLFASVIGIPLAILGLLVWIVLSLLAGPFAAYLLGRYVLRSRSDNAIWIMLLGAAILLLIYFIPVLGQLVALAAFWFGLGTILWQLRHSGRPGYHMAAVPVEAATGPVEAIRTDRADGAADHTETGDNPRTTADRRKDGDR